MSSWDDLHLIPTAWRSRHAEEARRQDIMNASDARTTRIIVYSLPHHLFCCIWELLPSAGALERLRLGCFGRAGPPRLGSVAQPKHHEYRDEGQCRPLVRGQVQDQPRLRAEVLGQEAVRQVGEDVQLHELALEESAALEVQEEDG